MKYFVDFEFTKFQGEIISMAIVAEDGRELYLAYSQEILRAEAQSGQGLMDPWVVKNVLPIIDVDDAYSFRIWGSRNEFKSELTRELFEFIKVDDTPIVFIADWWEDIKLLTDLFIKGPGIAIGIKNATFVKEDIDAYGPKTLETSTWNKAVQHNALWDARMLKIAYKETYGSIS